MWCLSQFLSISLIRFTFKAQGCSRTSDDTCRKNTALSPFCLRTVKSVADFAQTELNFSCIQQYAKKTICSGVKQWFCQLTQLQCTATISSNHWSIVQGASERVSPAFDQISHRKSITNNLNLDVDRTRQHLKKNCSTQEYNSEY